MQSGIPCVTSFLRRYSNRKVRFRLNNNTFDTAWTRMTPAIAIAAACVSLEIHVLLLRDRNVARVARRRFHARRNHAPFVKAFVDS